MLAAAKSYIEALVNALYPRICIGCGSVLLTNEEFFCIGCETELPFTYYWHNKDNKLAERFAGRVKINEAVSLFYFKKGTMVQEAIHQIKYRGQKDAAVYLGHMLGSKLKSSASSIVGADIIVPVPLHLSRLKVRGYNQCDYFAQGLSEALQIPWSSNVLYRPADNISQTKKRKLDRWDNVAEIFELSEHTSISGKHVLLVDDVLTTGATAESCMATLQQAGNVQVSFAAIAMAIH